MKSLGIDLSINGTGLCLIEDSKKPRYWLITSKDTKKNREFNHKRIQVIIYDKVLNEKNDDYTAKETHLTTNIYSIVNIIKKIVKKTKPDIAIIEGISYGSSGDISGLSGLNYTVRYILQELNVSIRIVSPTSNKKFATGNGAADKELMAAAWMHCDPKIGETKQIKIDDLADAYFLACNRENYS